MYRTQKSATCCYCGTKTVLTLGGETRHELKCSACGAPLSRMKALHKVHVEDSFRVKGKKPKKASQPKLSKKKKQKKRKSTAHRLFDIAEDVFDLFD
ncbi:hypothetical protein LA304_00785 [Celeribacter sp. ASW11-22]|nr:hypothetical protein [Celeribacter litoreus]